MLGLCLSAGALVVALGDSATLRWTHSVQKTLWEEDYRVNGNRVELQRARVQGTGAGMEPPPDAQLRDGAWHYQPLLQLEQVVLRHSRYVEPYTVCTAQACARVDAWLPGLPSEAVLTLRVGDCAAAPRAAPATQPP